MAHRAARITASCLLLVLLEFATSSPLSLKEGEPCTPPALGRCRRVRHCPPALEAIQQRRPLPQRCGFAGFEEIVCCPDSAADAADREVDTTDRVVDATDREVDAADRGDARQDNDIPTGDDSASPAHRRPSVEACSAYKEKRGGLEEYILLGQLAGEQELPHMAALGYQVPSTEGVSWLCGGTLISDQFVLTAAHCCASRLTGRPLRVRLGVNNLTATADAEDYEISEIMMHPNYRKRQYHSDIALLKLDRKVEFSDAVYPACLNTQDGDPPSYIAAGWGATNSAGTRLSSALLKTKIYPYTSSECMKYYKERFPKEIYSSVICAGDPQGKTVTCIGDSGTPLVTGRSAPYTAFGVTSLGPKPCGGSVPSLYTRVSRFLDWIERRVWP